MSKYKITYEVEAIDLEAANSFAHALLFVAELDAETIEVEPVRKVEEAEAHPRYAVGGLASQGRLYELQNQVAVDPHPNTAVVSNDAIRSWALSLPIIRDPARPTVQELSDF